MAMPSSYKPSPLSFGSPRTSPFRRPESPASPSASKIQSPIPSPSKLQTAATPVSDDGSWTPRGLSPAITPREPPISPTRGARTVSTQSNMTARPTGANADALAKFPPAQVREMREGFQILDRDSDGHVNREDVVDMLTNLGQEASPSTISQYFPPGAPQTLNMPSFLNTLSSLLGPLSSQQELVNAFAAFDDDDSGQIDVAELRDALLHTNPESGERPLSEREVNQVIGGFKGRREFARGVGGVQRGDVFRYQDFVANVMGSESSEKVEQDQ